MWAEEVTYVMKSYDSTNKVYTATDDQNGVWSLSTNCSTSNQLPADFSQTGASSRGICFVTPSNVTVTSQTSFTNVTKIVVEASSNIGSGTGTLEIKVGTTSLGSKNLSKINHTTYEFTSATPLSGVITLIANQGKNSVWIGGFKVTTSAGGSTPTPSVTAPTFDVPAGTYTEDQLVMIDNYNDDYIYAYTLDGTDPAFDGNLDVTNGTAYDKNEGIEITSSCTLKAIAIDEDGNASSITSAAYVINKPQVFASLEELAAADLATGTNVTVSFENVAIKDIFVTQQGYRNGVYFDIQKGGKDIEIYYQNVPEEWIVGGTLSGTMTCPWKLYSGTWELAPEKDTWAWANLTYKAPAQKTITALAVSGTPTKTTYNVGDAFETAGLVVTATYSDNTTAPITTGFEWEIDYGTGNDALVAGATSVGVMVYTEDNVMSEVYTVEGLTVTVPVTLTSIAVSGTPTKTSYYVGDAFETAGLVVTGSYSDSHQEVITDGIEWTVNPETLTLGTTSVEVMAGVGEVVSEVYTVEGLTVTKPDFETVTYDFSSFTSGTSVELTDLEGFVITLNGNGGTNPAWSSSQARVYAKGSLTVKANNATIKSIEYAYTVNANNKGKVPTIDGVAGTTTAGAWDVENKTWTGADEEVTFSTSGDAGNIGFTKLTIKYTAGTKTTPTLSFSASTAEVTIGADNNVFPTLTTTPVDLAGVTYESSNTAVATIDENTGVVTLVKAGETTITANYAGNAEYAAATPASYTLTVVKAPFVPTPAADGYETVNFTTIYSEDANVEDYEGTSFAMAFAKPESSRTPTKFYENGNAVRAYTGNTITITGAENIKYVGINWTKEKGEDAGVKIEGLGTTTAIITFSATCSFDKITVDYTACEYTRSVTSDNFGTICLPYATSNVEGATIYNIVGVKKDGEAITGIVIEEAEENLIAGKPYIFKATGATLTVQYSGIRATEAAEAKGLVGNLTNNKVTVEATGTNYVIGNDNKIHKVVTGGTGVTIGANRAYLNLAGVGLYNPYEAESTRAIFFGLDGTVKDEWGTPTGIESVETTTDSTIYNLQGQRVNRAQKGVYVVNGRKVIR